MKKFLFSLGLIAMVLNLTNCAQYEDADSLVKPQGEFGIYASVSRTTNDGLNTVWEANDQLNVFHAEAGTTNYLNDTPYLNGAGTPFLCNDVATGYFRGTLHGGELDAAKSYDWYAFYPYKSYMATPANDSKGYTYIGSRSDKSQMQNGNNSMAHIAGENYPMAGYAKSVAADVQPSVVFSHIASLVEFEIVNGLSEALTVSEIKFTAEEDIVGSYYINFADYEAMKFTPSGDTYVSNTASLLVNGGEAIEAGKSAKFYLAVKPFTAAAGSELKVAVSATSANGNGSHTKSITLAAAKSFEAGKIKNVKVNYTTEFEKPAEGVTLITTLTNANIAANSSSTGYSDKTLVDDKGYVYKAHAILNHHSNTTTDYKFLQIKKGVEYYIQLPNIGVAISKIEMIVSNTNTTITGGGNSATLYFSGDKNLENAVGSGTGASSVTISMPSNTLTQGYILASGAVRIWEIKIYGQVNGGEIPDVPATPVLEVNPATVEVAAAGGNAEFGYTVTNPAEGVSVEASTTVDWISGFNYATAGKVTFTVAENTVAEAREAVITLAYTGAESKTVTVKQAAAENIGGGEGQTCTVTYTVATTSSCTTSGTAPQGSSASYSQTYSTKEQLTSGNSATFTLKGYTGATITGMVLNMKSNASKGAGKFSVVAGSTTLAAISSATNFNAWYDNNSYGGTFRDINVVMTNDSYVVGNGENVVVKFEATTNSIYIHSITLKYTIGETPDVPATPVLSVDPTALEFGAAAGSKTVACTIENEVSGVNVTATENVDWLSTSVSGKTVTITATENTGAERTANVTIAYEGAESKTVTVKQAAAEVGGGDEPGTSVVVLREEFDNTTTADSSSAISTSKFPNFSGATSKAFTSKYGGLKFGSSSAAGYITSKSLDLSSAFTVQIDACKYGSDTGNIVVTCGSQSQTIQNSELGAAGSFKTFTLTFAAATATSTVKIATSSKRAYIDNVVITRN